MGSSQTPVPSELHTLVSLLRHLHWEEYKHSSSVQSLLITPETGQKEQMMNNQ